MGNTPAKKTAAPPPDKTPEKGEDAIVLEVQGHEYTIVAEARNDFELVDDLNEAFENGNLARVPSALRRMLGAEQAKVAMERLRDEKTGRIPADAGFEFFNELIEAFNPN
jgi:hypothetical protein